MRRSSLLAFFGLTILFATTVFAEAQELRSAQTAVLRLTIAEAVLATSAQLSDRTGSPIKEMSWIGELGDRNWSLSVKGSSERGPIEIRVSGFLWGGEGEDWAVSYSGTGQIGGEPIQVNGKMDWPRANSDRLTVSFNQVAKFGDHSTWAWIHGTEITVGVLLGGGAAVVATSVAPPLTILVGLAGAMGGASAAASVSNTVRSIVEGDGPPPPPAAPSVPTPKKDERLTPQNNVIAVVLTKDGNVSGSGPEPSLIMYGKASGTTLSGAVVRR
jgi:hypothetical protein